jgi:large subunit ribosomal protein L4
MVVPVLNMAGEEVSNAELPTSIFDVKVNRGLMHQALVRQMANARQGTHKAKGRSEINRTSAKAYRQKGTGRARHGSRRAPIFVGGGVAHGPKPRSYAKKMNRKMRRAALRSALTAKARSGDIILLDSVDVDSPKTQRMANLLNGLVQDDTVLLLLSEPNDNLQKSANNLPGVKTLLAGYLNIRDLLGYDRIVLSLSALELINGYLGTESEKAWEYVITGEEE